MNRVIALDIATKTGIAILDRNKISVYYICGSPVFQWQQIRREITKNAVVVIEDFSYFNFPNPETTAILNQRLGYLYWRIVENKTDVTRYNVNTVRKFLGVKGKKQGEQKKLVKNLICQHSGVRFTADETDAIALIMYHIRVGFSDLHRFQFEKLKRIIDV